MVKFFLMLGNKMNAESQDTRSNRKIHNYVPYTELNTEKDGKNSSVSSSRALGVTSLMISKRCLMSASKHKLMLRQAQICVVRVAKSLRWSGEVITEI